jgi:hypothetical protein
MIFVILKESFMANVFPIKGEEVGSSKDIEKISKSIEDIKRVAIPIIVVFVVIFLLTGGFGTTILVGKVFLELFVISDLVAKIAIISAYVLSGISLFSVFGISIFMGVKIYRLNGELEEKKRLEEKRKFEETKISKFRKLLEKINSFIKKIENNEIFITEVSEKELTPKKRKILFGEMIQSLIKINRNNLKEKLKNVSEKEKAARMRYSTFLREFKLFSFIENSETSETVLENIIEKLLKIEDRDFYLRYSNLAYKFSEIVGREEMSHKLESSLMEKLFSELEKTKNDELKKTYLKLIKEICNDSVEVELLIKYSPKIIEEALKLDLGLAEEYFKSLFRFYNNELYEGDNIQLRFLYKALKRRIKEGVVAKEVF